MNMTVPEARAQLAQRLAESVTGHDKLGIPGFEALDERVRALEQAIEALILAWVRAALESMPAGRAHAPADQPGIGDAAHS